MAKRKHAAALFEVIHHSEQRKPISGGRSPMAGFSAWLRKGSHFGSSQPPAPKAEGVALARSGPSLISRLVKLIPSMPRIGMELDPDRQIVKFRLSYTTALIAGFVVFAVVALAFVVGKHVTRRVTPALANMTTDELRSGPAQPDVLDVGSDAPPLAMATNSVRHSSDSPPAQTHPNPAAPRAVQGKTSAPAATVDSGNVKTSADRDPDRQYIVVQCYPEPEKQMADEACAFLNKNGVPCTVEFNTYYAKGWYAVVGIAGFNHIRNAPEYESYIATINQLSAKFGEKSRFKKFDPKPMRWQPASKGVG